MIRAIIIDDEINSRDSISQTLKLYCPEVHVVAHGEGVESGIEAINLHSPDLVFLDIKMQDGTGFDLLKKITNIQFKVIFITAYEEYAIKAFKFNAIDYLTKPVDPEELKNSIEKVMSALGSDTFSDRFKYLLESMAKGSNSANRKIVLRTSSTVHVVEIDNIIRCESDRNYTTFYLDDGDKILISKSMREFEDMLDGHDFFRVHNSHLINLNFIKKFLKDDLIVVLKDNSNISVAYRKRDELLRALKAL